MMRTRRALLWSALVPAMLGGALVACSSPFTTDGSAGHGGATTTTFSGGAGGSGNQGGSGLGGGVVGGENCGNGVDDDGDQLADCADSDCATSGYQCIPVPAGWGGPVAAVALAGQDCPDAWSGPTIEAGTGVTADPLGCNCTCGGANNAGCSASTNVSSYSDAACGTLTGMKAVNATCSTILTTTNAVVATKPQLNGTCGAGAATVTTTPQVQLVDPLGLCVAAGALGGGCDPGAICAPSVGPGALCIYQPGDVTCPGGLEKQVLFTGFTEGRSCGCECAISGSCTATLSVFGVSNCTGTSTTVPANGTCVPVPAGAAAAWKLSVPIPSASCQGTPGSHGSVTAADPLTVCCLP